MDINNIANGIGDTLANGARQLRSSPYLSWIPGFGIDQYQPVQQTGDTGDAITRTGSSYVERGSVDANLTDQQAQGAFSATAGNDKSTLIAFGIGALVLIIIARR